MTIYHSQLCSVQYNSVADVSCRAFLIADMESKKNGITTSGATCVSALLHNDGEHKKLFVANVGDSRAVLCASLEENTEWVHASYKYRK